MKASSEVPQVSRRRRCMRPVWKEYFRRGQPVIKLLRHCSRLVKGQGLKFYCKKCSPIARAELQKVNGSSYVKKWNREHPEERRQQKFIAKVANTHANQIYDGLKNGGHCPDCGPLIQFPNEALRRRFASQIRTTLHSINPAKEKIDGDERRVVYGRSTNGRYIYIHFATNFEKTEHLHHLLAHALRHVIGSMLPSFLMKHKKFIGDPDIDIFLRSIMYVKITAIAYSSGKFSVPPNSCLLPDNDFLSDLTERYISEVFFMGKEYLGIPDHDTLIFDLSYPPPIPWGVFWPMRLTDELKSRLGLSSVDM